MNYTRMTDYNFVKAYTLEKFEEVLPQAEAHYIAGTTMVTIPDAPQRVPLKVLCDRVEDLTNNRKGWTQAQEKTAAMVCTQLEGFHREGYFEYAQGLPCCCVPFFDNDCGLICCDCPSMSVLGVANLGSELTRKLIGQDPDIFRPKPDKQ